MLNQYNSLDQDGVDNEASQSGYSSQENESETVCVFQGRVHL